MGCVENAVVEFYPLWRCSEDPVMNFFSQTNGATL